MSKISIGQMIEVQYFRAGWEGTYRTKVEDVQETGIALGIPFLEGGGLLPLRVGESITILFWDRVACFAATTEITQVLFDPIPLFKIVFPNDTRRFQRRSFVRVDASLPLTANEVNTEYSIESKTIDVSGGGIKFYCPRPMAPGTLLDISINCDKLVFACRGEVVRDVLEQPGKHQIGVRFLDLEDKQRDNIISWVFKQQLELRKRGLI